LGFGVGVERCAGKDHAVVVDDGVLAHIAFNLVAVTLDERAVFFKRLNQLQDAAHVFMGCFTQLLQFFVDHHGAYAIVHVHLQQQRAIYREGQDVAALHAGLAGFDAVLQIKRNV
jgi:hypothetical protein